MPTRTTPRTTRTTPRTGRTGRPSSGRQSTGRFARSSTPPPSRYGMAGGVLQRGRRSPQPSGLKGALGGLGGMLPARSKATPSSKRGKAGGFALVTAAAGFAFSNRDKLTQMIKQRGNSQEPATTPPATTPPATSP